MHLKILIGVFILGLVTASPKAAPKPKPIAKVSPQIFQGYPSAQSNYFAGIPSFVGQGLNLQPILGQDAAGYSYNTATAPSGYQSSFGSFGAQGTYPQASIGDYRIAASGYYQPSNFLTGSNYLQSLQGSSNNYYQPSQAATGNYYQPSQAATGNYYQPSQLIPVPVGYPSGSVPNVQTAEYPGGSSAQNVQTAGYPGEFSAQNVQTAGYPAGSSVQNVQTAGYPGGSSVQNVQTAGYPGGSSTQNVQPQSYYGAARLWPKALISPVGSPSPVPDNLARAYYAVSTPNPLSYTTTNIQAPLSTQPTFLSSPQYLTPVPVKVDSRNPFQSQITNNNIFPSVPISGSTPSPYIANFQQQLTSSPYDQSNLQSAGYSLPTSTLQPPTVPRYPVNYQSTPAPFQINYSQSTSSPVQANYQSTPAPTTQSTPALPVQPAYQQQFPFSFPNQYQPSTPASYQGYSLPEVSSRSPFAGYQQQPTSSSYVNQFQKQSLSPFGPYYQPTASSYQQRIPVPVALPQNPIRFDPTPPTPVIPTQATPTSSTPSYPNVPVTSKPITILPTSPTPVKEVAITENTFIPIPDSSRPANKTKAKIIKTEYSGSVSPQYNHIPLDSTSRKYSTQTPFLAESGGKSSYGFS